MKTRILYFIVIILVIGCSATNGKKENQQSSSGAKGITISGKVGYPQSGVIVLEKLEGYKPQVIDTIQLAENNTYSHKVAIDEPGYFRLNFYDKQYIMLILDHQDIEVNVDGNSNTGFKEIKGSKDHDFIAAIEKLQQEFQTSPEVAKINDAFNQASQSGDEDQINALRKQYMELDAGYKKKIAQKFLDMPASLATVGLLQTGRILDKDQNFDVYESVANKLEKAMPNNAVAKEFIEEIGQLKKLAIGKVAPEISLPNPDGEVVPLSSLRGKYVLVDFWAKWCRPCRMENPNVVRLFNKYNKEGFEVYGVSLDRRKEDWLKAIEEDGLNWTQVSDLKFWQSEAARIYNVKAIPFALLLDPDGVIIGKNLRGPLLESKLEEIFGK